MDRSMSGKLLSISALGIAAAELLFEYSIVNKLNINSAYAIV